MKVKCICIQCHKIFFLYPSVIRQGKGQYCSRECSGIAHDKKVEINCATCSKSFKKRQDRIYTKEGNFCSYRCKNVAHSKFMKKKPIWNKGLTKKIDKRLNHYRPTQIKRGQHLSPSTEFKKGRKAPHGKDHPSWKGGKITFFGYRMVIHPTLRYKNGNSKYVFEHRLVMEQYIGRPLEPWETIHHKNRNKLDNRIENLDILIRKTHFSNIRCPHCLKNFLIK